MIKEAVNRIKRLFHERAINQVLRSASKLTRQPININKAKRIGILFNASNPHHVITVTKFSEKLTARGKQVEVLGYVNNKNKDLTESYLFNNNDLNWYGLPVSDKVNHYVKQPFDILISAFVDETFPLEYITAASLAKFRVGAYHSAKTHCFDFMINLGTKVELNYLLQQINHFLEVINKEHA